MRSIAAEQLIG